MTTLNYNKNDQRWLLEAALARDVSGPGDDGNNPGTGTSLALGSGVYFDNCEVPLPNDNCLPRRKRRRVVPHAVQGKAMLPPPPLCNLLNRCPSPVVSTSIACQGINHQDYGWTSYVGNEQQQEDPGFSFREAALALTSLCETSRKVSRELLHSEAENTNTGNSFQPPSLLRRKRPLD